MANYQDYVIKDGALVGDFEGLYRDFDDPWLQSREDHVFDSRRQLAIAWCERLRKESLEAFTLSRVLEVGCGFGYLTNALRERDFSAIGVDVAPEAIRLARQKNPAATFLCRSLADDNLLVDLDPDVVIMAEVTWYVLDELDGFLARLRAFAESRDRPTYLVHLLTTYPPGIQKYGREFFTDLDGILRYLDLDILEAGQIQTPRPGDPGSQGTYVVARVTTN